MLKCNGPLSYTVRSSSGVCWNHHIDHLCQRQASDNILESPQLDSEAFVELPSTASRSDNEHMSVTVSNPPPPQPIRLIPTNQRSPGILHKTGNRQIATDLLFSREGGVVYLYTQCSHAVSYYHVHILIGHFVSEHMHGLSPCALQPVSPL